MSTKVATCREGPFNNKRVPLRAEREEGPNWGNLEKVR
jgi:hypothetical protein